MNFLVRPSKSFLFDILEKNLKKINYGVGLDAGSADMKNRRFFKSDVYYGLDINLASLQKGVKIYKSSDTFGILADLTNIDSLPGDSLDVVVSTNTIHALPPEKRIIALKNLCRITAPDGNFLCMLPLDKDFKILIDILKKIFKNVKVIYFRNIFSRFYEWIFIKDGFLGSHPIAGLRPFRLLAWLISRLEYFTYSFPLFNKQAFIICSGKITSNRKNVFKIDDNYLKDKIYNLLN